ncbi:MAG: 2-oxoacid:acceptor oxidoreductase family protein, partial [Oscillospiraceae bacterium]|nr:2-oxoacid:acceptor oxidoreductase family protein [Oscillospiraceae bacterium]
VGGRYGLSSKDTDPVQIAAVFDNLKLDDPIDHFSVGIEDDVTFRSLPLGKPIYTEAEGTICCKFWGLGSDGTVGANKNSIKIISDHTPYYAQAYFEYDTKKSFGITKSHLRFGKSPIRATHLVKTADFVACHNQSYLGKYEMITELRPGGTFLLNTEWPEEELSDRLPADVRAYIANNDIKFYIIDANAISVKLGLGTHANMVLQSAFFGLSGVIPAEEAIGYMKAAAVKTYGKKGDKIVNMNLAAIDAGIDGVTLVNVPESWKTAVPGPAPERKPVPKFISDILEPINAQKGDSLPVSAFIGLEDGTMPMGTSAYEKRGIAAFLPVWDPDKCLQCNMCSYVCPHAVIRPYLLDEAEAKAKPESFTVVPAKGKGAENLSYAIQISNMDCTGCGSCASVCPAKEKALTMVPASDVTYHEECWDYTDKISEKPGVFSPATVKGSQFIKPLVEFSGACAGCGETPYAKLLTQLFGDRMYWANATGCSQAWGASMPCVPYTVNKEGKGPAWSNS